MGRLDLNGHQMGARGPALGGKPHSHKGELSPGLGSRRDSQYFLTMKGGDVDLISEGRLEDGNRKVHQNIVAKALENFVGPDVDGDAQIANS